MENICSHHRKIIQRAEEMINIKSDNYTLEQLVHHINHLGHIILDEASEANEKGQAMENRLKEYRNAIEALGFIRNNK